MAKPWGIRVDTTCILGLAKAQGRIKTLLDLDRGATPETLQSIARAAA